MRAQPIREAAEKRIPAALPGADSDSLCRAFEAFNSASSVLAQEYGRLVRKVELLSDQLESSHAQLSHLLANLPCGVAVVTRGGEVTSLNQKGRELFQLWDCEPPFPIDQLLGGAAFTNRANVIQREHGQSTEITLVADTKKTLHLTWSTLSETERVLVAQDVTALRKIEEEARASQRTAAMGEMAIELAHEIRNPLAALELFATLLREQDLPPEKQQEYLDCLQTGIRSMSSILANMLTFSRNARPAFQWVRLGELVRDQIAFMEPLFQGRQLQIELALADQHAAWTDPQLTRQILTNLLTNAMRALPFKGTLRLACSSTEAHVTLEVTDNGSGMSEERCARIFEPGFSTSPDGFGLGLPIVRKLMHSMQGEVACRSQLQVGTTFTLTFASARNE